MYNDLNIVLRAFSDVDCTIVTYVKAREIERENTS